MPGFGRAFQGAEFLKALRSAANVFISSRGTKLLTAGGSLEDSKLFLSDGMILLLFKKKSRETKTGIDPFREEFSLLIFP